MKRASWLSQQPLPGVTPHAEECLAKIRRMLPHVEQIPQPEEKPERIPGEDDEEAAW